MDIHIEKIEIEVYNPCPKCGGRGRYTYPNTTKWRGGVGGQAMTEGICDKCWGSGTTLWSGPNARELEARIDELQAKMEDDE